MMNIWTNPLKAISALALALIAGCGGGGGGSGPSYSLGGTVAGLSAGRQVVLLSGAGTQATLSSNGNFRFPDALPSGAKYNLTVLQQPLNQTCAVSNGSDTVGIKADVSNITVVCADNPSILGGTVSGLPAGTTLTVSSGAQSTVMISANGPYTLPVRPASGTPYTVSITSQPTGAQCVLANSTGTAGNAPVNNIDIQCSRGTVTVGGDLSGLAIGQQVQLKLVASGVTPTTLALSVNGSFTFAAPVTFGGDYQITIDSQPSGQSCTLSNAAGTTVTAPVTAVRVSCALSRHALGGSVTGLMAVPGGQPLVLRNGNDLLSLSVNGPFQFPSLLADGAGYSVTVVSQPTGQTCSLLNDAAGAVSGPVSTVLAQCLSFVWRSRLVAGSGMAGTIDEVGGSARFSGPSGLAIGPRGDLLVADFSSSRIRSISVPMGAVTTLAGSAVPGLVNSPAPLSASFRAPAGLAVNRAGDVFVADSGNHVIRRIAAGSGEVTIWAGSGVAGHADGAGTQAQFNNPRGLAIDAQDNLYVADTGNHTVRRITPAGVVILLAGSPGVSGRGDGAATAARFNGPAGLAISPQGVLVVADTQNHLIRALTPTGQVATVAGSGQAGLQDGSGNRASFSLPLGVAVDAQSTVYVADSGNHTIRQVQLVGTVGTVLTIAGNGTAGYREGLGAAVSLNQPTAVVVDAAGNLVIAEGGGQRVRTLYRSPN